MRLRKAAPPLKEGGKSKTQHHSWDLNETSVQTFNQQECDLRTNSIHTEDFHINTTPYTQDQIHKNVFLPHLKPER